MNELIEKWREFILSRSKINHRGNYVHNPDDLTFYDFMEWLGDKPSE